MKPQTMKPQTLKIDENHIYRLMPSGQIIPGVTEIIETFFPFEGYGRSDNAANFGKAVHKAISLEIKGTLNPATVDLVLKPYLNQFWKYFDDRKKFQPEI